MELFSNNFFQLVHKLISQTSEIIVLVFILSRTKAFKSIMQHHNTGYKGKFTLILFFGAVAILGTDIGIPINGAYANTRAIGIITGGFLGGPVVGIGTGLIAGIHRWTIGGFTAFSSSLSSLVEGVLAGYLSRRMPTTENRWVFALLASVGIEMVHMFILLFFSQSVSGAFDFVRVAGLPNILLNAIGVVILVGILENIFRQMDKIEGVAVHVSLKIADQALSFLRNGLDRQSADKTVRIILDQVGSLDAVAITSVDTVLAFAGPGADHHSPKDSGEQGFQTESTKKAIQTGQYLVYQNAADIGCSCSSCPLKSKVVVPIKEYDRIVGALVLYRLVENGITHFEIELALGLARLISSQLEMGKREREKALLAQSELKALQAQINPHFLFNTLNTIAFCCRTQPNLARELIIHLSDFYRNSLARNDNLVDFSTELSHVDSYVKIEEVRFQGKLEVIYDVDSSLQCMIPPLILQPIVENSIQHGLYPKREGGRVIISARKEAGFIRIVIEDNGIGMSEDRVKRILLSQPGRKSIGLSNVNARLQLLYPDNPGLQIESLEQFGTKVTILIPVQKEVVADDQSTGC
jgi:two-component system sensor histidine kinase LytS